VPYPASIEYVEQSNQSNREDEKEDSETEQTCKHSTFNDWYHTLLSAKYTK